MTSEGKMWWDIAIDNLRQKDALDAGGSPSLVLPGSGSRAVVDGTQRPYALPIQLTLWSNKAVECYTLTLQPQNILTATGGSAIADPTYVELAVTSIRHGILPC